MEHPVLACISIHPLNNPGGVDLISAAVIPSLSLSGVIYFRIFTLYSLILIGQKNSADFGKTSRVNPGFQSTMNTPNAPSCWLHWYPAGLPRYQDAHKLLQTQLQQTAKEKRPIFNVKVYHSIAISIWVYLKQKVQQACAVGQGLFLSSGQQVCFTISIIHAWVEPDRLVAGLIWQ